MKGASLLEVVVGLALLALILPLALNLIPAALVTQGRAADLQGAGALALSWIEECKLKTSLAPGVDRDEQVVVGTSQFHVVREIYAVDSRLVDVVVSAQPARGTPIRLATRLARK